MTWNKNGRQPPIYQVWFVKGEVAWAENTVFPTIFSKQLSLQVFVWTVPARDPFVQNIWRRKVSCEPLTLITSTVYMRLSQKGQRGLVLRDFQKQATGTPQPETGPCWEEIWAPHPWPSRLFILIPWTMQSWQEQAVRVLLSFVRLGKKSRGCLLCLLPKAFPHF